MATRRTRHGRLGVVLSASSARVAVERAPGAPPPETAAPAGIAAASPAASLAASGRGGGAGRGPAAAAADRSSRSELNAALLRALAQQFRSESLPWVADLVEPLLAGPPQPLTGTSPPEQLADPDSRFLTVHGVRLHYKLREPGEWREEAAARRGWVSASAAAAPTLLLMHGLNGSTFSWRLLLDDLAAYVSPRTGGCRVIAYDRPPYGLSQRPLGWPSEQGNPYTLAGGASLAAGLLDALADTGTGTAAPAASGQAQGYQGQGYRGGVRRQAGAVGRPGGRAVLVGHSAGAAVAVETALRYPELVAGLVLAAPAVPTDERGFLARADLGQLLRFAWTRALLSADGPGVHYVRRQVLRRKAEVEGGRLGIYSDDREAPQEVIDGYLRPLLAHDWDAGTLQAYRALQVAGSPPALQRLRVPVLVLAGRQDRAVPLEAVERLTAALRRRGPGVATESVVLDPCGHVPMEERPLETLRAIVEFVNRHCC